MIRAVGVLCVEWHCVGALVQKMIGIPPRVQPNRYLIPRTRARRTPRATRYRDAAVRMYPILSEANTFIFDFVPSAA